MGRERGSNIQQWNRNNTSFVLDENVTHILYQISLNLTENLQQKFIIQTKLSKKN